MPTVPRPTRRTLRGPAQRAPLRPLAAPTLTALIAAALVVLLGLPRPASADPASVTDASATDAPATDASPTAGPASRPLSHGLTAVEGVLVGHHRLAERPTGCTVIRVDAGAVAAVDVRGGAPGTRETDLLDPANTVERAHAIVLAGGSAFGLAAADGVMHVLAERGIGFPTPGGPVPIVPAAILYDLQTVGRAGESTADPATANQRVAVPGAECGRRAALGASSDPVAEGSVGAGAGATVGKLAGFDRAMKSGVGSVALRTPDGTTVAALAAVNALGDVIDPATGRVVAGARGDDGRPLDARRLLRGEIAPPEPAEPVGARSNTTLVVVATDAALDQAQATRLARMAQDGLARSIDPVHTPWDGDVVFVLATGGVDSAVGPSDLVRLGALAADVVARAVVRAVEQAEGLPGLPAVADLEASSRPR